MFLCLHKTFTHRQARYVRFSRSDLGPSFLVLGFPGLSSELSWWYAPPLSIVAQRGGVCWLQPTDGSVRVVANRRVSFKQQIPIADVIVGGTRRPREKINSCRLCVVREGGIGPSPLPTVVANTVANALLTVSNSWQHCWQRGADLR